ncbi:unnamed protein product [Lymnaea stagnalis]|uniref:NADH dehydrogenase [ubiquinone] 1 alpha subcomplex subunit 5 n=1 Tax=Lymnaea stagnalis TaxID=6523 RepID=A0AAV2HKB9_LYMST
MAGVHKLTTGLTGLAVAKHPHQTLRALYSKILSNLQKMPASAGYRKHTEQIINQRLGLVKAEAEVIKLEEKINCGQIEEVIKQAERELRLSRKMLEWKPWEPLIGQAPPNQWKWPLA